jgi:hypothetical protein
LLTGETDTIPEFQFKWSPALQQYTFWLKFFNTTTSPTTTKNNHLHNSTRSQNHHFIFFTTFLIEINFSMADPELLIHFNFSANISVIPDAHHQSLITVGNTQAFQTLSSSDLSNCQCLRITFFCNGTTVLRTNIIKDSSSWPAPNSISTIASSGSGRQERKSSVSGTTHGLCTR